ncbi:MAG: AglZ/HisF2 family acetamidino modification protein [Betaproteobacteria bacterium]|jgi:cyclase
MLQTRVIPCLLLQGEGLVKTTRFKAPTYVGDPINAIRIFNDKEVDELIFLDITASREGRGPAFQAIRDFASECFMPVGYGGGIRSLEDARQVLSMGIEKIILNTMALRRPELVSEIAREFGSQAVVVSIDAKKKLLGGYEVIGAGGTAKTGLAPAVHAQRMVDLGAGEIFLNAIDRDGTLQGYDLALVRIVAGAVSVPVIACGGAGSLAHFAEAVTEGHASAVAAGSMFVFHGKHRAVLISYPNRTALDHVLSNIRPKIS